VKRLNFCHDKNVENGARYKKRSSEMSNVVLSRRELEDVWRERLSEALQRYQVAKLDTSTALFLSRQDIPQPDGQFAFRKAQRAEAMALAEYKRVMKIFNDLVIDGKVPPDA
jgi:hypothetical protein